MLLSAPYTYRAARFPVNPLRRAEAFNARSAFATFVPFGIFSSLSQS
jgi:hypothetical protein